MKKNYESGRSMVEMLGVLAIVGVLSIGGIAGYTNAMNSHKASETVQRLMKRAMIVSSQRLLGQTADISGFNTNDGTYAIPNTVDTATAGKFGLTVNGVAKGVCEKILGMDWKVPTITPASAANCVDGNMTFTFNNDLSGESGAGEAGAGGISCADPCGDCEQCEGGRCVADSSKDGSPCNSSAGTCNSGTCEITLTCTPDCAEYEECVDGVCVVKADPDDDTACSKNSDCNAGCASGKTCYCSISSYYSGDDTDCYYYLTGTCAEATTLPGVSGGYVASNDNMTWWSAVNFCKAIGGSLASLSSLGITGGYESGYCSSDCTGSFTWEGLQNTLGYEKFWMKDAASYDESVDYYYTYGNNNRSCNAWVVNLIGGGVNPEYRDSSAASYGENSNDQKALCVF